MFFRFSRDLRCIRNTIHANLMLTYLLLDITWILTAKLQSSHDFVAGRVNKNFNIHVNTFKYISLNLEITENYRAIYEFVGILTLVSLIPHQTKHMPTFEVFT